MQNDVQNPQSSQAPQNTYSGKTRSVAERFNRTKVGKAARKSGFVTAETVVMWAAYVVMVLCNIAFEAGRLGGTTASEVSARVFTWFTPAGYVFSIWALIYVALIVWLVQYTRSAASRTQQFGVVALLFVVSCVLNVTWLAIFHFELISLSLLVILAFWAVLVALYVLVRRSAVSAAGWVPLSIYMAWLSVALVANFAHFVTRALNGGIPVLNELSLLLLVAGVLAVGYVMCKRYRDKAFPLVVLWAVIGVGVHVSNVSILVALAVFLLAALGALATLTSLKKVRALFAREG